jgi:hypothetical protein
MEINPNRSVDAAAATAGPAKSRGAAARVESDEDTCFQSSNSLNSALEATPDSRSEVVSRAENLVASSSYPPPELIQRIANLLAANLITKN